MAETLRFFKAYKHEQSANIGVFMGVSAYGVGTNDFKEDDLKMKDML